MRRLVLTLCCLLSVAVPASASAADFNPAPGTYVVDTTALTITGPGTNIFGVDQGGVAVFEFGTVHIGSGVTLNASGSRPLRIVALGDLTLAGVINGNGTSPEDFNTGPGSPGGPGGGSGGSGSTSTWTQGTGTGGGRVASSYDDGGGGGGFGGAGARGGTSSFNPAGVGGAAGPAYGSLDGGLVGGSGGAGSSSSEGGGGGGAIALFGRTVTITGSGQVHADGGGGAVGTGASGGGSGGGIMVVGSVIDNQGQITARGGQGGAGGCCGDGGGGGGGRVAFRGTVLKATGTPDVTGGTSGTRSSTSLGHGALSPDPQGADGVVTRTTGTRLINFDDLTAASLFVNSEGPLRNRYAGQGLRFTGPAANDGGAILDIATFGVSGQSGLNALAFNTGVSYSPAQGSGTAGGPETITFDTPISTATVNTGQGGGGTATMTAFRGSTVVGSAFRTSTATLAPLTVSGEHISKLMLSFTGNAIVFDDLRWNTEPTSNGDSFSVNQGGTLNVGASGVLGNDSDPDGDPLTATLDSPPANGSVSLRPDGGFTYTPKGGFTGTDSFIYSAGDGAASGNGATVSISVIATPTPTPVPKPPLLKSTVSARWLPSHAFTEVLALSVNDIPARGQVRVQCETKTKDQQSKGCPFKSKTYKVKKATRKLNLLKPFREKKVPVGAKIAITITAPGFTGKRFTYVIRPNKAPKPPKPVCILTSGKPGACPS